MKMLLTGVKDLDFKILNDLEDVDLVKMCQMNRAANDICTDQNFWLNRIMIKFPYLSIDIRNKYKGDRTWSEYYINDLRIHYRPDTLIILASRDGRLDLIIIALHNGANIHAENNKSIRLASMNNHVDVVKYLIEHGADINAGLTVGVQFNNLDVVKYLIEHGANPRAYGDAMVYMANDHNRPDIVDYLVSHGTPDPRV